MTQPGIGAMLHYMRGGSENDPAKYLGRKITAATLVDDRLRLTFDDGVVIAIWDDGQSCCESRYMRTDDDLQSLVGHGLIAIETKAGPDEEGEYGDVHEQVFLEIRTDNGFVTVASHNEHNGYYGGFGLTITEEAA